MVSLSLIDRTATPDRLSEGSVVLRTCNRSEMYSGRGPVPRHVARHLFRVVSGLESTLPGEKAIQGQVKSAYLEAVGKGGLSGDMHKLFQRALYVGKKVRTSTAIDRGALSHCQASVDMLLEKGIELKGSIVTLIGAHNMNERILRYLVKYGSETVFLGNRTFSRAKALADKYDCRAFGLDSLREKLALSDIVISATSAPHHILTHENTGKAGPLTIVDLAVPADASPDVTENREIRLFSLGDVEKAVARNEGARLRELEEAGRIIDAEVEVFLGKLDRKRENKRDYRPAMIKKPIPNRQMISLSI